MIYKLIEKMNFTLSFVYYVYRKILSVNAVQVFIVTILEYALVESWWNAEEIIVNHCLVFHENLFILLFYFWFDFN